MRKLILGDSTEYELDWCNGDKGVFFANLITSESLLDLVMKFSNPELTKEIKVSFGDSDDALKIYEGYTFLKSIVVDEWRSGTIMVTLEMPEKT